MSIEAQIELEKRMVAYGITRYRAGVKDAEEKERAADTQYSQVLMREFVEPVADAIQLYCDSKSAGPNAKFKVLLRKVDPLKAAYFGLRCLFNHFMQDSNIHKLANHVGVMIEDELKFSRFQEQHGEYYDAIIKDFKSKGTTSYRHMHRVLTHKANEKEVSWKDWNVADRVAVGAKVIDCILEATDLCTKVVSNKKGKTVIEIVASEESKNWVSEYNKYAELLNPDRIPCVVAPDDWTAIDQGGYYTPQLRKRTPMVKTRSKEHAAMFEGDIENITSVINTIQNVPWQINKRVLEVFKHVWNKSLPIGLPQSEPFIIPQSPVHGKKKSTFNEQEKKDFEDWKAEARLVHTMEKERVSKCFQVMRVLRLANEFKDYENFWYVYQTDFRGRIYASVSGLSPQGPDFAKALLQFGRAKPLTKRGVYWLRVHGANVFGEDKLSYADRVQWTLSNEARIIAVAEDPLSNTDFWGNADKPWQFLAFCFEYKDFIEKGIGTMSRLPIGLDGSCNGLQNFSAMLRDEVGAAATNLIPADLPSDIYTEVAKVCSASLWKDNHDYAKMIQAYMSAQPGKVLPRGIAKRPVMTLPYGSTQQSCREYIYQWIVEDAPDIVDKKIRFKVASYLTPILWAAISKVVVAARVAMDWIQKASSSVAKANKPLIWWTPIGFPVYQGRKRIILKRVETQLAGVVRLQVGEQGNTMDVNKNKLGSAPNFVHSMDACHLMMTCQKATEYGLTDFAFIHDDYGTHASDTDTLHQAIREAFVDLYTNNDPLLDFKIFNEDNSNIVLPELPRKGSLNIGQVIDSEYFFG